MEQSDIARPKRVLPNGQKRDQSAYCPTGNSATKARMEQSDIARNKCFFVSLMRIQGG